jgi:hypothetical protein
MEACVVRRVLRIRGRIKELRTGENPPERSVASIQDVDEFIRDSFETGDADVRWEIGS